MYGSTTRLIRRRICWGVYWSKSSATSPSLSREATAPFEASQDRGANIVGTAAHRQADQSLRCSFSILPALKNGSRLDTTLTTSPLLGFLPV